MEKGHKIHLWAHIRMFWDNAFYATKGNLRREKRKRGGRVRSWTESDARSLWASKSGEKRWPVILQTWFSLWAWWHLGSLVEQTSKSFKINEFIPRGSGLSLSSTPQGVPHYHKFIQWKLPENSPPHFPILFKTLIVKLWNTLRKETKFDY